MVETAVQIPPGYIEDSQERLVPLKNVKQIDLDRDKLVRQMIDQAATLHESLAQFRELAFASVDGFVERAASEYGTSMAGEHGGVTLSSYDGKLRLRVSIAEKLEFDERLQVARKLVNACLQRWGRNAKTEIKTVLRAAFETDKRGQLDARRILGLRKLDIDDEEWQQAMQAISDSVRVARNRRYLSFQRRGETGKYETISLSLSSV